ncbi:MAG: Fic family protein [Victivallales bacterium]|nr:Fic family protein [Victivallales bacterium]
MNSHRSLASLETASGLIPDMGLYLSMYVRKEALISSKIEGTQCTLEDVLDPSVDVNANRDVSDVIHYVQALQYALARRETLPLCNRLLLETHAVLLEGMRGADKSPGEFRRSQNWIGGQGCSLREARYVPPNVEDMQDAMYALEAFMNAETTLDPLVCAALVHYQFETIHPFLDGNGRIGRLLILLYLIERKLISKPILYVSYFLKRNQIEYYDRMTHVRNTGDYEQWVRFFLEAVNAAAEDGLETANALAALHRRNEALLFGKDKLLRLFKYIEQFPIIDIRQTATALGVHYNTAAAEIARLQELGILRQTSNKARNRLFAYTEYISILKNGTE